MNNGDQLWNTQQCWHQPVLQGGEVRELHVHVVFSGKCDRCVNALCSNAITLTANEALARSPPCSSGSTLQRVARSGVRRC